MPVYPNDMLTMTYLAGVTNEKPSKQAIKQQYRGLQLLPWEQVGSRQIVWDIVMSTNNLAGFYDPRGQAVPMSELSFGSDYANLIDMKASANLETWAVEQLREPGMLSVWKSGTGAGEDLQSRISSHINSRIGMVNEAVDAQIEYTIMQVLTTGAVVWPPKDNDGNAISPAPPYWGPLSFTVQFKLPAAQRQNVSTLTGYNNRAGSHLVWSNASSTPFDDLELLNEMMLKNYGVSLRGGTIYLSEVLLGLMSKNTSVLQYLAGTNREQPGARLYGNVETVKTAIKNDFGWNIETYDAQWTFEANNPGGKPVQTRVDFMKYGKVLIMPPGGNVGTMATARQQAGPGRNAPWMYGKVPWMYEAPKPPYDIELGVNAVAWPKLMSYDWCCLDALA